MFMFLASSSLSILTIPLLAGVATGLAFAFFLPAMQGHGLDDARRCNDVVGITKFDEPAWRGPKKETRGAPKRERIDRVA
jgi:hypothetical protein